MIWVFISIYAILSAVIVILYSGSEQEIKKRAKLQEEVDRLRERIALDGEEIFRLNGELSLNGFAGSGVLDIKLTEPEPDTATFVGNQLFLPFQTSEDNEAKHAYYHVIHSSFYSDQFKDELKRIFGDIFDG